ncbi:uncharacterized protein LOC128735281 [Sabethes cyaneus]|uniref:uncharacterized protein LOC128735281 n=1 Tax=Sabethes cyaneus TaxID=53552 RepID=UPI00237D8D00|nr:uncharacterized protein LOC128735281 [Sabethes cyaneus]
MKQFRNPVTIVIVLVSVLNRHEVKCITNGKSGSSIIGSATSSTESSQQLKDLKTDGTSSFWSPHPEYYHERDRYNRPDRTDFVTSYGNSYDSGNKYGGGSLSSSSLYGNKDRLGVYNPLNTGTGDSYYSSGGVYDRKYPPYGPPQPVDFPAHGHEYEAHPGYNPHGYGYSLGEHYGGKDFKSFLIPLAGAALLGIAAALVVNPVLLHLGAAAVGKRKRRDVTTTANAHNLAYRAWLLKPTSATPPST